ncbi:MAG: DUF4239 domain-containing protein [Kofleriaceae bacterium]|nr:DUF4239 domain-containing protein [Myxococcales bacterium]MCB9560830.1 DUF4239 domain-containing protein [Kofleriaceae bacterium]
MGRTLRTVTRLVPIVAGSMALGVAGLWLIRALVPQDALRASNDVVGNYLQGVDTMYAVLLAFVVFVVWQQFDVARGHVEREANDCVDLHRIVGGLGDDDRARIQGRLERYLDAVLAEEWTAMSRGDEDTIARVTDLLDAVWDELHDVEPVTECQKALHAEALSCFNDLSDARMSRLTAARTHMPLSLRMLLYMGAVVVSGSMYLVAVDRFAIHAIITAAMVGAVSHILYVVEDLDDAFSGDWQVSRAAFVRARARTARATAPQP